MIHRGTLGKKIFLLMFAISLFQLTANILPDFYMSKTRHSLFKGCRSAQRLSRPALKCHSCETFYCTRSVGGGLDRGCKSNVWISPTRISWNSRGNDPIPLGAYFGSNRVG